MAEALNDIRVKVDAYTRVCLTLLAGLLTVLIVGLWARNVPMAEDARAAEQFNPAGAERAAMVEAQNETNRKLGELIKLLESGRVRVRVIEEPEKAKPAGGPDVAVPKQKQ